MLQGLNFTKVACVPFFRTKCLQLNGCLKYSTMAASEKGKVVHQEEPAAGNNDMHREDVPPPPLKARIR